MIVIRLARTGKKGERKFRIVVKEKRSRRDGNSIENLGWYIKGVGEGARLRGEETKEGFNVTINKERLKYWISQGAKPSPTVSKIAGL